MKTRAFIHGIGYHVPEEVVTNADLEKIIDTSDEWIVTRTGIRERRKAAKGEASSDIGAAAARKAMADAGISAEDITHIVVATLTPDSVVPATAYPLQEKLGIKGRMGMDFSAACSGFVYGLELSRALCALHPEARVLLVASEILSSRTNWADRTTCILFGDGAGAVVVSAAPELGGRPAKAEIMDVIVSSDGSLGDLLTVKGGGSAYPLSLGDTVGGNFFVQMQGREVFKHAVRHMEAVSREIMGKHHLEAEDIDLLIPHQANMRIIEAVGQRLELPKEKIFVNVDRYGNTSAASIAIALAEAWDQSRIASGDNVVLTAFGGGFTWGSALLKFV